MKPITRRHLATAIATMTTDQLRTHLMHLELRARTAAPGDQSHRRQIAEVRAALLLR